MSLNYSSRIFNIEAEHLPVGMSARHFVRKSEFAAIQTMDEVYCEDQKTFKVMAHPRISVVQ